MNGNPTRLLLAESVATLKPDEVEAIRAALRGEGLEASRADVYFAWADYSDAVCGVRWRPVAPLSAEEVVAAIRTRMAPAPGSRVAPTPRTTPMVRPNRPRKPTPREGDVLDAIEASLARGVSPTHGEVARAVGMSTDAQASICIKSLVAKGYLTQVDRKQRSIQLTY